MPCIDVWRYFSNNINWNTNYIFNLHPLIPWIIRHIRNRQEALTRVDGFMIPFAPIWFILTSILCHFQYTFDTWYYGLADVEIMRGIFFSWHVIAVYLWWTRWGLKKIHLIIDSMDTPENGQPWSRLWLGPLSETSHCHNQSESSSQTHACVTKPQWVHTDRNCQCTRVM